MWPPVTSMSWLGLLCVLAAALSAGSETTVYGKVGDEVHLRPEAGSVIDTIVTMLWKDGSDLAIQWDGTEIDSYRQFKERGHLNISNGVMTITGLIPSDSGVYTPEINNVEGAPIRLIVISAVPVPTVSTSCDEEMTNCNLTCDGQTSKAEEVTYTWKSDDSIVPDSNKKQYAIVKENSAGIKEFSCEVKNQVSHESSQPIPNPFITNPAPEGQLKISTGLTVFICLLAAVLLLGLFHRWKAGMWFYEKASMPWEADFWRKHERPARDAAESNGTTAHEQKGQSEEETPMT